MEVDPAVQVAVVGIVTTFITTAGVVVAAFLNRKGDVVAGDVEGALRDRIAYRDEWLLDIRRERDRLYDEVQDLRGELRAADLTVRRLREALAERDMGE